MRHAPAGRSGRSGPRRPLSFVAAAACLPLLLSAAPSEALTRQEGSTAADTVRRARSVLPGADTAASVHLITVGQGNLVWEKFGHNALWIHDPEAGRDVVYNWGIFDFAQADFFRRLLFGHMRYMVAATSLEATMRHYRGQDRTVRVQRLRLTPAQVEEVRRRARIAVRPENRFYDYDPFLDNCSSRIRDLLDAVLDGEIRARTDSVSTGSTFRSHTRRLLQRVWWGYAGSMAGLGAPTDRGVSVWDEMFLPMRMAENLRDVRVAAPDGRSRAVAGSPVVVHRASRPPVPERPPGFPLAWALVGLAGGGALLALGRAGGRGSRGARHGFGALSGLWSLAVGLLGVAFAGAWIFTEHWYTHGNENLLQLQPLSLALALLLPLAASARIGRRPARVLAWVVAGLAVAGVLLQLLPGFDQVNGEVLALTVPLHAGTLGGLLLLERGSPP